MHIRKDFSIRERMVSSYQALQGYSVPVFVFLSHILVWLSFLPIPCLISLTQDPSTLSCGHLGPVIALEQERESESDPLICEVFSERSLELWVLWLAGEFLSVCF